jgi:hypothetical protein
MLDQFTSLIRNIISFTLVLLQTKPTPHRPQHPTHCETGWYANLFQYYHPNSRPQLLEIMVWEYLREKVFARFCFGLDNAANTRMGESKFEEGNIYLPPLIFPYAKEAWRG